MPKGVKLYFDSNYTPLHVYILIIRIHPRFKIQDILFVLSCVQLHTFTFRTMHLLHQSHGIISHSCRFYCVLGKQHLSNTYTIAVIVLNNKPAESDFNQLPVKLYICQQLIR